jgi:hypothetical protein
MLLFHVPIGYNIAVKRVLSTDDASEHHHHHHQSRLTHRVASLFSLRARPVTAEHVELSFALITCKNYRAAKLRSLSCAAQLDTSSLMAR